MLFSGGRGQLCDGGDGSGWLGLTLDQRTLGLRVVSFAYALSLLLLSTRLINTLKVHRGVGVLVIMLGQMLPQIAMWFLLAMCITSTPHAPAPRPTPHCSGPFHRIRLRLLACAPRDSPLTPSQF